MSTTPETVGASQMTVGAMAHPTTWETSTGMARTPDRPVKVIHPPAFSIGTISTGLRTLVQYSDLLYTLSLFRLSVRYKQSALGWTWAALQPLALMGIYTLIFTSPR